ncbi:MAG: Methyltransferase type 12 [Labilithrix sp.]|nr:Methyltransferase type 12 [Labilithrix sp.]
MVKAAEGCPHPAWTPLYDAVPDYEHRASRAASFVQCPRCELIRQEPLPSADTLRDDYDAEYPADYRAHVASDDPSLFARAVARLKEVQAGLLLAKIRRFLPDHGAPILELGCGAGHFLRRLRAAGFSDLHGVDRNAELGPALRKDGIAFTSCDLDRGLPLERRYHTIVLNYLIEHLADPEAVLRECAEHLVPGGQLLILTPNSASVAHRVWKRFWSGLHAPRHTFLHSPASFRSAARALGFERIDITFPTDPGSWALSAQNFVEGHRTRAAAPRYGTKPYALGLLPFVYPLALAESAAGRGSSMLARLVARGAGGASKPARDAIV